jgi:hypothetical protein
MVALSLLDARLVSPQLSSFELDVSTLRVE